MTLMQIASIAGAPVVIEGTEIEQLRETMRGSLLQPGGPGPGGFMGQFPPYKDIFIP